MLGGGGGGEIFFLKVTIDFILNALHLDNL